MLQSEGCAVRPGVASGWMRLAAGLLLLASTAASAGTLTVVDPAASYPEGPLWQDGKLYYVEYAASNIKAWDGQQASVHWHKDGCGANGLIPFHGVAVPELQKLAVPALRCSI